MSAVVHQRLAAPGEPPGVEREIGHGGAWRAAGIVRHGHRRRERHARSAAGRREPGRHHGERLRRLGGEDPQLRVAVGLEAAVAVEVVGCEVEQHGGVRRELERVLELERRGLEHDHGRVVERAGQRRQRRADVPRHGDGHARLAVDLADQLRRRRLPVRTGDRDHRVRQQPPPELELAEHDHPALARGADDRGLLRHAGALDERLDAREQVDPVGLGVDADAGALELPGRARVDRAAVGPGDLLAAGLQRERGRPP